MTELISKCQHYKLQIQKKSRLLVRYESGSFFIFLIGRKTAEDLLLEKQLKKYAELMSDNLIKSLITGNGN